MLAFTLLAALGLLMSQTVKASDDQNGLRFYIVGDYGWIADMTDTNRVFDSINEFKGNAAPGSKDDGEFFLTVGDNLYPLDAFNPQPWEFETMMNIFARENIADMPVHAIRGNHDCYFDENLEINLSDEYEQWNMPSWYYKKEWLIGEGKKFGVLMVDSCLMLCADWSYAGDTGGHMLLTEEHKKLRDVVCTNETVTQMGNDQFDWINKTMEEWDQDEDMIWKATVLHHPMWGKWYPDFANIVSNYLPLLLDHKFDAYLNGHEHVMAYATYPHSQVPYPSHFFQYNEDQLLEMTSNGYDCEPEQENFFGEEQRQFVYKKGEALHQITTGMSGFDKYLLCLSRPSMGNFHYAQNVYHGFSSVHITPEKFELTAHGLNYETDELHDLFSLTIMNDDYQAELI